MSSANAKKRIGGLPAGNLRAPDFHLNKAAAAGIAPLEQTYSGSFSNDQTDMTSKKVKLEQDRIDRFIADALSNQKQREQGYREQALKIYPWICARCGREFSGKRLRELTVHHKDHNHDNNPPDGSNWELLCLYCHDNAHARYLEQQQVEEPKPGGAREKSGLHKPFADLANLLKDKK